MHYPTVFGVLTGVLLLGSAAMAQVSTWSNDQLTYRAEITGQRWNGEIVFRGQVMPMYGMIYNNQYVGEFQDPASKQSFTYQAAIDGDTLVFRTGNTTYRLTRQAGAPQPNPINPVNPVNRDPRPATRATTGIRLRPTAITDPSRGNMVVSTFLAPADWKMESGVVWRVHHMFPAAPWCKLIAPDGIDGYISYPTLPFVDGVREFAMGNAAIQNDYWRQQAAQQYPEGGAYMYNEIRTRPRSPQAALGDYVIARFRPELAKTKVTVLGVSDMPGIARLVLAEMNVNRAQGNVAVVTRIRLGYELEGIAIEEDFFVTYMSQAYPTGGLITWQLGCNSFRARKGELDQKIRIMQVLQRSAKLNPQFVAVQANVCQIFQQGTREDLARTERLGQLIRETNDYVNDVHKQIVNDRWQKDQRIADERGKLLRGVEWYNNPFENKRVELPSGYKNVFVNRQNEYILTDDPNYDPAVAEQADWRRVPVAQP